MTTTEQEWFAYACDLEGQIRQLHRILTALVFWLAEREELLEYARAEIERQHGGTSDA